MVSTKISYIYGLYSTSDNLIRYIGYSHDPNARFKQHITNSKYFKYRKCKWIQSELKSNSTIKLEILRCVNSKDVFNAEIETIALYKSFGANLTNGNIGGKGGTSPNKEVREKIRLAKLGNQYGKGIVKNSENIESIRKRMTGRIVNVETCLKISKSKLGKPAKNRLFNEEQIINIFKLYNEYKSPLEISELTGFNKKTIITLLYTSTYLDIKSKFNLKREVKRENGIIKFNNLRTSKKLW